MRAKSAITEEEPSMFLQRPSSARSQDVSHVLTKTFRHLFTRETVSSETVKNLNQSKLNDDSYQSRYAEALKKAYDIKEKRLADIAMLEKHIMQAQARAMAIEEKELNKVNKGMKDFPDLGLPPEKSHFRNYLDYRLLKSHNLLTPEDFASADVLVVPPPSEPVVPSYARDTVSSNIRNSQERNSMQTPLLSPTTSFDGSLPSDSTFPSLENTASFKAPQEEDPTFISKLSQVWKGQMNSEEREINRATLANQQRKVDYLKNPRHIPPSAKSNASRGLLKSNKNRAAANHDFREKKEPSVIFLPSPQVVTFRNYSVGKVYEITLELKNVTGVLRPVRVIPPESKYFSLGLGQFPGEHGLVAPGMSCYYAIRFSPDSLSDYHASIRVQTQSSADLEIRIQAVRQPPCLTLPKKLNVDECLVGGCKITRVVVKNTGGAGRFCMMQRSQWPASSFKSVASLGCVSHAPFIIRPNVFSLEQNESTTVEIFFFPQNVCTYTKNFIIACDNCQIQHLSITGMSQMAKVDLLSVEDGLYEPLPGETCDTRAPNHINFESLNPYTYMQRTVIIKNNVNVSLAYHWQIIKPRLQPPQISKSETNDLNTDDNALGSSIIQRPSSETALHGRKPIKENYPPSGYLTAPVTPSHKTLPRTDGPSTAPNLTLKHQHSPFNIIDTELPNSQEPVVIHENSSFKIEPEIGQLPPMSETKFLFTYAPSEVNKHHSVAQLVLDNIPVSSVYWNRYINQQTKDEESSSVQLHESESEQIPTSEPLVRSMTSLEIEVKGKCEALDVSVQPSALYIPGKLLIETVIRRPIKLINESKSVIFFDWNTLTSDYVLQIEPSVGELAPCSTLDGEVIMSGSRPGKIAHTLYCTVQHLSDPIPLYIEAEIKGPELEVDSSDIDFGLIRLGEIKSFDLSVSNLSPVATNWFIEEFCESEDNEYKRLFCEPASGMIGPLEKMKINIVFKPEEVQSLDTLLHIKTEDGYLNVIAVKAEVQRPDVCLLACELTLPDVYLNVLTSSVTHLYNKSELSADFEWAELSEAQSQYCSLLFEPKSGVLAPRQTLPIKIHLKVFKKGLLTDMLLRCHIFGKTEDLILSLSADVKDLSVSFRTEEYSDSPQNLCLDFGETDIAENKTRQLYINNNTGIAAEFLLSMERFKAHPPTPPPKRTINFSPLKSNQRRLQLSQTPTIPDPYTRTPNRVHKESCAAILSDGNGAAFLIEPAVGVLEPFSEQMVTVTSFSDTWGKYSDNLICDIEKLDQVKIAVKLDSFGCPLTFQMASAQQDKTPIVRFGTHVLNGKTVTRPLRINNSSPFDIRVDWQVFDNHCEDKLFDFITSFGEYFPRLDKKGNVIIPEEDDESNSALCTGEETVYPKLVSITLRDHTGIEAKEPYSIKPAQFVIPGKGSNLIHLSFSPENLNMVSDFDGFALGYMTIDDKTQDKQVQRKSGYELTPIKLNMTANTKPALLTIETADDEGMRFRAAASELLNETKIVAEVLHLSSATLLNNTETPLKYRLGTNEPFVLVNVHPKTKLPVRQDQLKHQSELITLNAQHNQLVHVGFRITPELLVSLQDKDTTEQANTEESISGDRKLHFHQELSVCFDNNFIQKVPLYATLILPNLNLSKNDIDFGTCFVGQRREIQLMLKNPTCSKSFWSCSQDKQSKSCRDDSFTVIPNQGILEAAANFQSANKVLLRIFFTPTHNETYEATFTFYGLLGEIPQRLEIKGEGSYDGKYNVQVDI